MKIENLVDILWKVLKEKGGALAMIIDCGGQPLWYQAEKHLGLSNEVIKQSFFTEIKEIIRGNEYDAGGIDSRLHVALPPSAGSRLKAAFLLSLEGRFFIYIGTCTNDLPARSDIEVIKMIARLFCEMYRNQGTQLYEIPGIIGTSEASRGIREKVAKFSMEDEPVLIVGETGVGKSYIAELIHGFSGRKGRFVVAEIASINGNLFESIMFGHKKGSFTDACSDKIGLVQDAEGGTLFFDDIADIPVSVQSKLLRFIETQKYRVLGEYTEKRADVRILAASNKDLPKAIEEGDFRADLYYRLQVLEIEIPPLRERIEDLREFVNVMSKSYLKGKETGPGFWEVMLTYDWPGNIRELMTVLKRAGILFDSPITGEAINNIILDLTRKLPEKTGNRAGEIWKGLARGKDFWDLVWKPFLDREIDRHFVKEILKSAYKTGLSSFKRMNAVLNIDDSDYHKFMSLMHQYRLDPRS